MSVDSSDIDVEETLKNSVSPRNLIGGGIPLIWDTLGDVMDQPEAEPDPMALKQAEIGAKEWERYKKDFAPKEGEFIKSVTGIGSEPERKFLKGLAASERQQQLGPVQATSRLSPLLSRETTGIKSQIPEKTILHSEARRTKGLETAINLGRDIGTGALGQIGRQGQIGTLKNIASAEAAGQKKAAIAEGIGTLGTLAALQYKPSPASQKPVFVGDINAPKWSPISGGELSA